MAEKKTSKPVPRGTIRAQYYHSSAGFPEAQKEIVRGLGFTRVGQTRELPSGRSTLAMVAKVPHLIRIIE